MNGRNTKKKKAEPELTIAQGLSLLDELLKAEIL